MEKSGNKKKIYCGKKKSSTVEKSGKKYCAKKKEEEEAFVGRQTTNVKKWCDAWKQKNPVVEIFRNEHFA